MVRVHFSTVQRIIKRFKENNNALPSRKGKCGRKKLLSPTADRRLARISIKNPRLTANAIQNEAGGDALNVSTNTIKRSLRRSAFQAHRPLAAPFLNESRMSIRRDWADLMAS